MRDCVIQPGGAADLAALSRFHYRGSRPATCVRVLRAVDRLTRTLAGVLAVSMPALNAPWREEAWGVRYSRAVGASRAARRVNGEVRTISRVIIEPRYRGLGVAKALVRAYLADPLTIRTESLAAMGRFCPFFERAGLRAIDVPRGARDERLAVAIAGAGVCPYELIDLDRASRVLDEHAGLRVALARWANDSRATRRASGPPEELLARGAAGLVARPIAYVTV